MMFENQVLRQTVRWADCPALDFLLLLTTLKSKIQRANLAAVRFVARQKKIISGLFRSEKILLIPNFKLLLDYHVKRHSCLDSSVVGKVFNAFIVFVIYAKFLAE